MNTAWLPPPLPNTLNSASFHAVFRSGKRLSPAAANGVPATVTVIASLVAPLTPDAAPCTFNCPSEVAAVAGAGTAEAAFTAQNTGFALVPSENGHHPSLDTEPATQCAPRGIGHCVPAGPIWISQYWMKPVPPDS